VEFKQSHFAAISTQVKSSDERFQWNRLPTEIRCISNTEQFKRHLKTFLFKSAFTDC